MRKAVFRSGKALFPPLRWLPPHSCSCRRSVPAPRPALASGAGSCPPWAVDGARWEVKVLLRKLPQSEAAAQNQAKILGGFGVCFFTCWDLWGRNTENAVRWLEGGDGWEVKHQSFSRHRFCSVRRLQSYHQGKATFRSGREKKMQALHKTVLLQSRLVLKSTVSLYAADFVAERDWKLYVFRNLYD